MRRPAVLLAVLFLFASALPAVAALHRSAPSAQLPIDPIYRNAYLSRQARFLEAESKSRLVSRLRTADKALSPDMELYDAVYYDLDLTLDPDARILSGTVTIEAVALSPALDLMELHLLDNMTVSAVRAGGTAASFTHAGEILTVILDRIYAAGETVSVAVDYAGNPAGEYFGWSSYGGQDLIWTLSEPYGARTWWPCKDLNTDKADSVDLHVTVPGNLIVASNGLQGPTTSPAGGLTTYHWSERYPIATYLVSVTAHPYALVEDVYTALDGSTMPIQHFVLPAYRNAAEAGFVRVPAMIGAFAQAFGEYPFVNEKYGHAHFPWGGGMEHQTCTSLYYAVYYDGIVSHELAHQWFGDLITCSDFHHIWLNEGFATWAEAYWREVNEGMAAYHEEMSAAVYIGPGTIYVEDPSSSSAIFDYNLTYLKASWVVHMLRHVVGDEDFFAGLAQVRDQYGFGSLNTEEFQTVFEGVSGRDLEAFFQQWIYGEYFPTYFLSWDAVPAGDGSRVTVRVEQLPTTGTPFVMPLDLRITTDQGAETFVIEHSELVQWFNFEVAGTVAAVELDPDDWVLCQVYDQGTSDSRQPPAAAVRILGNAPNPFNPVTNIRFELATAATAELEIIDLAGRRLRRLDAGALPAGVHEVTWDGRDRAGNRAPSGTYFVRLRAGGQQSLLKISLVQ